MPEAMLLTTSETGLGKRTNFDEYPKHSRGGQGVITHNVTDRTGRVVSARAVFPNHELIVMSESGIVMRTTVDSIARSAGRRRASMSWASARATASPASRRSTCRRRRHRSSLPSQGLIDDLEVVPEPWTAESADSPRRRRRARDRDAKPDNGSNGRGRGKK